MDGELTTTERAGMLAWALCRGDELTLAEAARLVQMSRVGAYKLLVRLCRKCPIFLDDDHHWKRCKDAC